MLRFHPDESVSSAVALGLRRRGIDVTTPVDAGLIGASDPDQLDFACQEGRVAVSHESDFLRLAAAGAKHAGIAYCQQSSRSIGQVVNALVQLRRTRPPEQMVGKVEFL